MKQQQRTTVLILGAFLFGITVALIVSVVLWQRYSSQSFGPAVRSEPMTYRHLDGLAVTVGQAQARPLAVMIENHEQARPVSGLEFASIIYEVIVEGDITRYLAIFDGQVAIGQVGPVRSARPFFVDLAEEWQPVYFHAGGSQEALVQLKQSPIDTVNEISADGIYFWRDPARRPPHNLYTSTNLINRAIAAKGLTTTPQFSPWLFKDDQPTRELRVEPVPVDFSSNPIYRPIWSYNQSTNDYTRFIDNSVDKTDRGIFLKTKNIVIQYVDHDIIDDYGRLEIGVGGSGRADIFQDGQMILGRWQKEDSRTRFYDFEGQEIEFNRGRVWIELVFNPQ